MARSQLSKVSLSVLGWGVPGGGVPTSVGVGTARGAGRLSACGGGGSKALREGPGPGRIINYRTDPFIDGGNLP